MDLAILQRIALELNEELPGGFVNKIHQPLPREIVVRVRPRGGGEKKLMLSADPALGRMHLTDLRIPNPPVPPKFCAFLRAHFQGSRIVSVQADPHDRVVRILATRGPENERIQRELILELLGRDANILLLDSASNTIMECLHRIPEKESGSRIVLPGQEYFPPPQPVRPVPAEQERTSLPHGVPGIRTEANGKQRLVLDAQVPEDEVFPSMNRAADAFYGPKLESAMLAALRRQVAAPVKARIRSLERREQKILSDMARLRLLARRQEEGELLKANLGRIRKGMEAIQVQDWATGAQRVIPLNPALDAVANMEKVFRQSAKGKRGEKKVQERLAVTLEEKRAVQDLLYFMEEAENSADLENMALNAGTRKSTVPAKPSRMPHERSQTGTSMFRRFETEQGRIVLVGKSAEGNDYLLRQKAHKEDLWFHAKGFPGAHVILMAAGKEETSQQEVQYAADLAVHFSKARNKGKVEVIVANTKDLERIKGGVKGQVRVRRYQAILSEGLQSETH